MTAHDDTGSSGRLATFFATDDDWEREGSITLGDWLIGALVLVASLLSLELIRGVGTLDSSDAPTWVEWTAVISGAALLVPRRRFPLTVALLAGVHMFVTGVWLPMVMGLLPMQIIYFVAFFAGAAWARSRRDMVIVMGTITLFMFAWIAWQFAVGSGIDEFRESTADAEGSPLIGPVAAYVLLTTLINLLYFFGAIVGGQVAWRGARQRAELAEQAATIAAQSGQLQRRAVIDERLRIARELHDVVAHHVAVVGVQAAAGRKLLERGRPDDITGAAEALGNVEASAREGVTQMRSLLGTLRDPAVDETDAQDVRRPEPRLEDLPALLDEVRASGLRVDYETVGPVEDLSLALAHSVYRIVQEALANVRRHSTADRAQVVLRVDRGAPAAYAEVEITDNGRPRHGTSGSGLGLLGVRERAAVRKAEVDIGPRAVQGFRVRVRFPLDSPVPASAGAAR
ncbi:signal transduction histidine kinase [Nocardioides luteus]|uniref:histidine kinase n=1 Tax=Nocardioides luteus TaxID=1844 RepID=A0ABQ5T091_9ACTN|nr:histidine kinase [Nocardioides luteus]MDR7310950.1 signal transduction histidine kinase [Nocardioides luteus]GGR39555.1 two-component sensor histidine kinase [Nocardioides luteus]GLJ69270.1 two-component sensor histidine kinase [Nocardioides luteus]